MQRSNQEKWAHALGREDTGYLGKEVTNAGAGTSRVLLRPVLDPSASHTGVLCLRIPQNWYCSYLCAYSVRLSHSAKDTEKDARGGSEVEGTLFCSPVWGFPDVQGRRWSPGLRLRAGLGVAAALSCLRGPELLLGHQRPTAGCDMVRVKRVTSKIYCLTSFPLNGAGPAAFFQSSIVDIHLLYRTLCTIKQSNNLR